jgi:phosphatidate cytidylyltransferase
VTLALAIAQAEWLQLAGWHFGAALGVALAVGGVLFGILLIAPQWIDTISVPAWAVATCAWFVIGLVLLRADPQRNRFPPAVSTALAFVLPASAWLAIVLLLRSGVVVLLSVFLIVWIADTAAYFAGRAFGKRKLAPHISPGKTWAGLWGAIIAAVAIALIVQLAWPAAEALSSRMIERLGIAVAILLLAALVVISVVGDLFESLLKRQAGAKDSGHLLPGHGGFYDRIDAMLAVLPSAALLWRWVQ